MDGKSQLNYYQILGVRSNATQEVLDAAYRRQVRLHTGEYLNDAALVAGPEAADPFLARVDEAYRQLSNPLKRWTHDEELREAQLLHLPEEALERARKRIAASDAWLSYQRLENGSLYIRVGWAADFTAIHSALNASIPESGRSYNPRLNEWRVDPRYEEKLAEIFRNFRRVDVQIPPPQVGPTYLGPAFRPTTHHIRRSWRGWPFLIISGLLLATVAALLFPANRVVPVTVQATATARALLNSYVPLESNFPTATPRPPSGLTGTLLHPSVNLRERPETDAPVLELLYNEETYRVIGRLEDSSWYVVMANEETGWMAAWTVAVEGEPDRLPVFTSDQALPESAGERRGASVSE